MTDDMNARRQTLDNSILESENAELREQLVEEQGKNKTQASMIWTCWQDRDGFKRELKEAQKQRDGYRFDLEGCQEAGYDFVKELVASHKLLALELDDAQLSMTEQENIDAYATITEEIAEKLHNTKAELKEANKRIKELEEND